MRLVGCLLTLGVVLVRPAGAAQILYTTAASDGRIDGYCIRSNGSLAPDPSVHANLAHPEPRRMLLDGGVLYVAEQDRVEAFKIEDNGRLTHLGNTEVNSKMNPWDIRVAQSTDGTRVLYVSQRGLDHVVGYRLDANGAPVDDDGPPVTYFTCLQDVHVRDIQVSNNQMFVLGAGFPGRLDVFDIDAQGRFLDAGSDPPTTNTPLTLCPATTTAASDSLPLKRRRRLRDPRGFIVAGDGEHVYIQERLRRRLTGLRVSTLLPPPPNPPAAGATTTTTTTLVTGKTTTTTQPKPVTKAPLEVDYERIVLNGNALLFTQFSKGRIDGYLLKAPSGPATKRCVEDACDPSLPACCLPKHPSVRTTADVLMSPVGMTIGSVERGQVLYVAGGILDRVRAYNLGPNGLPDRTHFSETNRLSGSFPNDVAVFTLPGACP